MTPASPGDHEHDPLEAPPSHSDWEPDPGRISLLGPGPLVATGLVGLAIGWGIRPVWLWRDWVVPEIGWLAIAAIVFVAAIVTAVAWHMARTVRTAPANIEPHHAVNRLALGKATAIIAAGLIGGYLGFGIAHAGFDSPSAQRQIVRAVVAVVASVWLLVAGLWLERACRSSQPLV